MKENKKKSVKKIAIITIIYIAGIVGYAVLFYFYADFCHYVHKQYETIKNGEIVEAELVRIEYLPSGSSDTDDAYNVWYEYIDGDIKYTGVGKYCTKYYYAEKSLGEKVEIYIDGKGLSIAVGMHPDTFEAVLDSIGMAILFILVFSWPFAGEKIIEFVQNIMEKCDEKQENSPLSSKLKK